MGLFFWNPRFPQEFAKEKLGEHTLEGAAERVRGLAESNTVRIMPSRSQGFVTEADEDGVRVVNSDHGGHLAEWGSAKNAPIAPLRRAISAAGLRLDEKPKP